MILRKARTFLPEIVAPGTGLSPLTDKSNNGYASGYTLQDAINGVPYNLPDAGGNWGKGADISSSYKEEGDDYARNSRDEHIFRNFLDPEAINQEEWAVVTEGGYKKFPSFQAAFSYQRKLNEAGTKVKRITRLKTAQSENPVDSLQIADAYAKTYMVSVENFSKNYQSTGSAFCIAPNIFATCGHVMQKYNKMNNEKIDIDSLNGESKILLTNGNHKLSAKVLSVNEKLDIAILQTESDAKEFTIQNEFQIGDDVMVIGSPHGYENNVTFGKISSRNRQIYSYEGAPKYMFIDAHVFAGNSGGPIISTNSGAVIGIVTAIAAAKSEYGLNAGLPIFYLEQYCQEINIQLKIES